MSDYDAVLLGIGLSYRAGAVEVLGEGTWNLLVGSGAPSAIDSPLHVRAGIRYHAGDRVQLSLTGDVCASGRPATGPTQPLVPLDPRFEVLAGLTYVLPFGAPPAAPPPPPAHPHAPPHPAPAPTGIVAGRVVDASGAAVDGAHVKLVVGQHTFQADGDAQGHYQIQNVTTGQGTLTITADGFKPKEITVQVAAGQNAQPDAPLESSTPSGQLRGLIRSFDGTGLRATVRVDPLGTEVQTNDDGTFQVDVPPGSYQVEIRAPGHAQQHRSVRVEQNGVTVLNADLRRGR